MYCLLVFTNSIPDIADPLFSKECIFKDEISFENYLSRDKQNYLIRDEEWLDKEYIDSHNLYLDALRCFL